LRRLGQIQATKAPRHEGREMRDEGGEGAMGNLEYRILNDEGDLSYIFLLLRYQLVLGCSCNHCIAVFSYFSIGTSTAERCNHGRRYAVPWICWVGWLHFHDSHDQYQERRHRSQTAENDSENRKESLFVFLHESGYPQPQGIKRYDCEDYHRCSRDPRC